MESNHKHAEILSLRAKDAAKALGISERKFREIQHTLPHVDLGGARVFPVEALRAWLVAHARSREDEIDEAVEEALRAVRRAPVESRARPGIASTRGRPTRDEAEVG